MNEFQYLYIIVLFLFFLFLIIHANSSGYLYKILEMHSLVKENEWLSKRK